MDCKDCTDSCYNLAIILNVDPIKIMEKKILLNSAKYPVNIT